MARLRFQYIVLCVAATSLLACHQLACAEQPKAPSAAKGDKSAARARVLIIGDSISMGYTEPVQKQLADVAEVVRIPANGGPTTRGLTHLDAWLGDGRWDVIHFNFGLHDLKYVDDAGKLATTDRGHPQVSLDKYEENLRMLVARLKKTGATLIYATTTPVPEGAASRVAGDERNYNKAALKVMAAEGVAIDDLCELVRPDLSKYQRPKNVHFTPEGSDALGGAVAAAIRKALSEKSRAK